MLSEATQSVLTGAFSAGGVVLAAAIGAYLAYRGSQRQSVWQHIYTKKFDLTAQFLGAADDVTRLFRNAQLLQTVAKHGLRRRFPTYIMLQENLHAGEQPTLFMKKCLEVEARFLEGGQKDDALLQQHVGTLLIETSNLISEKLFHTLEALQRLANQLEILLQDPRETRRVLQLAKKLNNELSDDPSHNFDSVDIQARIKSWDAVLQGARKALRKDLHRSSRSFRQAVQYSKSWMRE